MADCHDTTAVFGVVLSAVVVIVYVVVMPLTGCLTEDITARGMSAIYPLTVEGWTETPVDVF